MESPEESAAIDRSPKTEVVSPSALPRADEFVLTDQQLELYEALSEKSEKAGAWYRGALVALSNDNNPERFVQAAHSIRELIKNLHKFIDVPGCGFAGNLSPTTPHLVSLQCCWLNRQHRSEGCREPKGDRAR